MLLRPSKLHVVMTIFSSLELVAGICRNLCGGNNIPIKYPLGIDDGCGASEFHGMLNCSSSQLFFNTPSGSYKIQNIDYDKKTIVLFDPTMSTCSILQPHHDFLITQVQSLTIRPSPDTVFVLVNCSADSPVVNRYSYLCSNNLPGGHTCDELYGSCTSFRLFHLLSNNTPPCCFTSYSTIEFMSMNVLDCTHYTSLYDGLKAGVGPLDWLYGIKLSYGLPDLGCQRCAASGGICGYDVDTRAFLCICSATTNSTRDCGGVMNNAGKIYGSLLWIASFILAVPAAILT